ncbi:MAG: hypothetical protein HZC28_02435 [Spirochaetes bacterium]|nr:hypothetical protein [Spirochaetota bacterium]
MIKTAAAITIILCSLSILASCAKSDKKPVVIPAENASHLSNCVHADEWDIKWSDAMAVGIHTTSKETIVIYRDASDEDMKTKNDGYWSKQDYTMLSVAGTVVSYACDYYSEGGAHPSYGRAYKSIDLAENTNETLLTDHFEAAAIFEALMNDTVIKNALKDQRPKNLNELFDVIDGGCEMDLSIRVLGAFALHHLKGDRVAVRIGVSHGCEAMRGNFTEIGVYLPQPDRMRTALKKAAADRTLMQDLYRPRKKK